MSCGDFHPGSTKGYCNGPGGSAVRLDPEREVMFLASNERGEVWYLAPIREIIDALEEE